MTSCNKGANETQILGPQIVDNKTALLKHALKTVMDPHPLVALKWDTFRL